MLLRMKKLINGSMEQTIQYLENVPRFGFYKTSNCVSKFIYFQISTL